MAILVAAGGVARAQVVPPLFSLDIGSDNASDQRTLDGIFDVADIYLNAPGHYLDDKWLFFVDPPPGAGTSVPVDGTPASASEYLDLDGFEHLIPDLRSYGLGEPTALPRPLLYRNIARTNPGRWFGVWEPKHLFLSFDDDDDQSWFAPGITGVPTVSTSPVVGHTFGTSALRDEVVWISTDSSSTRGTPVTVTETRPAYSESDLNSLLAPNPDASLGDNDDVYALELNYNGPWKLFTVDHEAHGGRNPAVVYAWKLGDTPTPIELIRHDVHLGVSDGVDIDAIELVWLWFDGRRRPEQALGLLFSVDRDDPATPADESGGLDPSVIYGSFLTGTHFEFARPGVDTAFGVHRDSLNLYRLDPITGEATSVGLLPVTGYGGGLEAIASDRQGRVFVIDGDDLVLVDVGSPATSTVYTTVSGLSAYTPTGAAFGDDGTLWIISDVSELLAVDLDTATFTEVASLGLGSPTGLAWDAASGNLWITTAGARLHEVTTGGSVLTSLTCPTCVSYTYSLDFNHAGLLHAADEVLISYDFGSSPPAAVLVGDIIAHDHLHGLTFTRLAEDVDAIAVDLPDSPGPERTAGLGERRPLTRAPADLSDLPAFPHGQLTPGSLARALSREDGEPITPAELAALIHRATHPGCDHD